MNYATLSDSVEYFAVNTPEQTAIIDGSRYISYKELAEATAKIAAYLQHKQIKRLAVHLPNCAELIYLYLACFKADTIAVPLSMMMKQPEVDYVLQQTKPDLIITDIHNIPTSSSYPPPESPAINTLAAIFYTSGSTGNPKGVVHTQLSLAAIADVMGDCFAINNKDRFLVCEAMTNASGCSHAMLTLQHGATVILMNGFEINDFIKHLHQQKPTLLCIMGKGNYDIVNSPDIVKDDFHGVRVNITGGDKVTPELIEEFQRKTSVPLRLSYGMSEILVITMNNSDDTNKRGSIGTRIPQVEIQLRDQQGNITVDDTPGEAWVKGLNMLDSYWQDPEKTKQALCNGWLRTGDVLHCDEEGFYWFYGRIKHIIVRQGDNISPLEVEKALMRHPAVLDAGVTGIDSKEEGQVPVAFIELRQEQQATPTELLSYAEKQLENYKVPVAIIILEKLPRTKSGKIDREKLKELYLHK